MRWKFFIDEPIWAVYLIPLFMAMLVVPKMASPWMVKVMILLMMVFIIVFLVREHYQLYKRRQEFNGTMDELYGSEGE